jgi:plasmid stability protein
MAKRKPKGKPEMPATEAKLRAVRLELPEDIHKLLRLEAAKRDTSLGELARQFVTEALTRLHRAHKTE